MKIKIFRCKSKTVESKLKAIASDKSENMEQKMETKTGDDPTWFLDKKKRRIV